MYRRIVSSLLLLGAVTAAAQQPAPAPALGTRLGVDPKVRVGTLPNGLRYYVRRNAKPEKRAELRLVVNAGSILENDAQRGYAHFVEHTAFNGTTHFAKNDLVKYLQSVGVRFGADLNAYTSFDETVYMLPIPSDTAALVEKGFQILEDWAHGQVFDSAEVVNERGVVREEWRTRKGASDRILAKVLPVALAGSRYAVRLPIGTDTSIMAATPSVLRGFYRDWYRPDLMAVIAVGDFDPAKIEAQIRQHFGRLKRPAAERQRVEFGVPDNRAPLVAVAGDPEATSTGVQVTFKAPKEKTLTVGDYRRDLMADLYTTMLNARLNEISQKPDAPFLGAGVGKGGFFARSVGGFTMSAGVKDGGAERGLEALLTESHRVDRYGYLQTELDRAKQNLLRFYERAYAERDKTPSGSLVQEYVGNFLEQEAIPGIDKEYELVKQLLPTISLADVNTAASKWITDENRVVVVTAPEKQGVPLPSKEGLLAVFTRTASAPVTAYAENVSGDALLDPPAMRGKIVSRRMIPGSKVTEWKLSNGARVLVKPTDFKEDEILFQAWSPGGTSLAPDSIYMSAAFASQIVSLGGAGKFNRVDLQKKLSGKATRVAPNISEISEGLSGSASPKDLETMLQLVNLYFTAPRLDSSAFAAFRNQVGPFLANRSSSPDQVFQDTVQATMASHHFRARPITPATFAEVDPAKAYAFYRDRFADAGDFTFVFVGNVNLATLEPLVEEYIATLTTTGRTERWKDTGVRTPEGTKDVVVKKGVEDKATTLMMFTGPFTYTPQNRFALRALTDYFEIKLIEVLREKLGGTYSPNVSGSGTRAPQQRYSINVSFNSSPANVEKLTPVVLALIDSLKRIPPSAGDVEKVRAQMVRTREVDLKQNGFWLGNMVNRDMAGEDIDGLLGAQDALIRGVTPASIQAAARAYFDTANYYRFVLLPEGR